MSFESSRNAPYKTSGGEGSRKWLIGAVIVPFAATAVSVAVDFYLIRRSRPPADPR